MSDTDQLDDTTADPVNEAPTEQPAAPAADDKPAAKPNPTAKGEKPPASTAAKGAMAATAMAAVPATGLSGALLYGNFGPMGVVAAGGVAAAAGGVALAVRRKKAADAAKAGASKRTLPPHPLGSRGGLMRRMKEKAAARREAMAARRAERHGQRSGGGAAGTAGRRAAGMAARVRSAMGGTPGGRSAGVAGRKPPVAGQGRAGHGAAGRASVGGGRHGAVRHGAAGGHAASGRGAHRPVGQGRAHAGSARGAAGGRYTHPTTGRPMTAAQVSRAIRHQQRAQRIVTNGGGRPTQAARWVWRRKHVAGKAVGVAATGLLGAGLIAAAIPVTAVAGIGLGAFGVAQHPAVRRVARRARTSLRFRAIMLGRWLRSLWRKHTGRGPAPLEGEIVAEPTPEPEVIDGEIVDHEPQTPAPTPIDFSPPAPQPKQQPHDHRRRRNALANRPTPQPDPKEHVMRTFDTLTETLDGLPSLSLGPGEGGGHDVERWGNSLADFIDGLAERIGHDSSGIIERFPMDSAGRESMGQLSTVFGGIASQVREQVEQWRADASWQYTDNNA